MTHNVNKKMIGLSLVTTISFAVTAGLPCLNFGLPIGLDGTLSLILQIFIGFLAALFINNKKVAVLAYINYLASTFFTSALLLFVKEYLFVDTLEDALEDYSSLFFNGTLIIDSSVTAFSIVILLIGGLFFYALYIDAVQNNFTAVELPFLVGLLFWTFLFSVMCFNFLLLFLLMEAITLLIVVSSTIYFVFIGPKLIKPLVQFFVLNLMISTFYLLGVVLILYFVIEQDAYTLSYTALWNTMEVFIWTWLDLSAIIMYFKLAIGFMLLPLAFKLTIAPFSIWIVNVYANLPTIFLLLIMTVYKIVYALLFMRLFLNVLDWMPDLQAFWQNSLFLFVVPSMFVGCLAYRSQDLKTIIAYTTVSQLGYIVAGFTVSNPLAIKYSLIYLFVYSLQLIGIFVIFLILQAKYDFTNLNQLFLVKQYDKFYYYLLFVIFFSLSGIPPLSGFFIKYFLFLQVYKSGFFLVAIFGLISGFIMALIYLQIVLQLMTVKASHSEVEQFEHAKKLWLIGDFNSTYQNIVVGLNAFLWSLFAFNIFFFFLLPELSAIAGEVAYELVYAYKE